MAFVAFEGLDGAGKSTLINAFADQLKARQMAFVRTREPGGSPLGEEIRNLLLRTDGDAPVPRAELLLYEAGRAQHVEKIIRPALAGGKWVLCDRYYSSTVAFQNGGRQLALDPIEWLNRYAVDGCEPDLWVLLDLDVPTAMSRMVGRDLDRFEREQQEFHERVRLSYLQQAKRNPTQWLVLSALDSPEQLLQKLMSRGKELGWL